MQFVFPHYRMASSNQLLMSIWNRQATVLAAAMLLGISAPAIGAGTEDILPPVPIYKVSPKHPAELYEKAIEGNAIVTVTVDIFGSATDLEVEIASQEEFGLAAMLAASEWIFEPATKNGVPIEIRARLPFVFEITFEHKMNVEMGREVFVELDSPIVPSSELDKDPLPSYVPPFSKFYPETLRDSGKSAAVNLEFIISPTGEVHNPRILSISTEGFEQAALRAISSMKYRPIEVDGRAAYVSMIRPIQITE